MTSLGTRFTPPLNPASHKLDLFSGRISPLSRKLAPAAPYFTSSQVQVYTGKKEPTAPVMIRTELIRLGTSKMGAI